MGYFQKTFSKLCTPAFVYFVLSAIGLSLIAINNLTNSNSLCIGNYTCSVPNTMVVLIVNAIYILFFTWILHLICKEGFVSLSWFLVLFPFVVIFLMLLFGTEPTV